MAEVTARIISIDGQHAASLLLSENGRDAWCLVPPDPDGKPITWIPGEPSTSLWDGLLMWMLLIAKVPSIVEEATSLGFPVDAPFLELQSLDAKVLDRLRAACCTSPVAGDPLIIVLRGSSVAAQISLVDEFKAPLQVAAQVRERGPGWFQAIDWRAEGWPTLFNG